MANIDAFIVVEKENDVHDLLERRRLIFVPPAYRGGVINSLGMQLAIRIQKCLFIIAVENIKRIMSIFNVKR